MIMRSLSAPSEMSPRRVQQTIKQKDAKFQTPKTHTHHIQISQVSHQLRFEGRQSLSMSQEYGRCECQQKITACVMGL